VLLAALSDAELDAWLERLELRHFTSHTVTSKRALRKIILDVREAGWAIVDQEYELGFRSLSVPIRDRAGTVVAALNISCPSPRVSLGTMRTRFLPEALETAALVGSLVPEGFLRRRHELVATVTRSPRV
jgi:IclR family pca regulon transcriptional regulator